MLSIINMQFNISQCILGKDLGISQRRYACCRKEKLWLVNDEASYGYKKRSDQLQMTK
jgi:hypothetical protein